MRRDYSRGWRRARARVLDGARICHLCGGFLDYAAPARSKWAPSVDHVLPLKATRYMADELREAYRLDASNLRPAHYGCNARRQAGKPVRQHVSRAWSKATKKEG
jgi:hypothetical protein